MVVHRISDYKVSSPPPPRVARGQPAGFLKSPAFERFNATPLHGLLLMEKTLHQKMTEIYWATCWRFGGMLSHAPCPVHPPPFEPHVQCWTAPGLVAKLEIQFREPIPKPCWADGTHVSILNKGGRGGRALIVEHVRFDARVCHFVMQSFLHQPLRSSHLLVPPTALCFADIMLMECVTSHLCICLPAFL